MMRFILYAFAGFFLSVGLVGLYPLHVDLLEPLQAFVIIGKSMIFCLAGIGFALLYVGGVLEEKQKEEE